MIRTSNPRRVCLSVDVEQDCPPFRKTYFGIEQGMPRLLDLLQREDVPATFFTTGDVARRYPTLIGSLPAAGHELGCHGDTHRRFDQMNAAEAEDELRRATHALRQWGSVTSFRAPNLAFPTAYLPLLEALNYRLDSSLGKHKLNYWQTSPPTRLRRVPASTSSSVLRYPSLVRNLLYRTFRDPIVLFVHPWEFVDWRNSDLRRDCRFRTGEPALECLRTTIEFFRARGADFMRLEDLLPA